MDFSDKALKEDVQKGELIMGTLWYGGTIYTMRNEGERVNAIYTDDGYIKETGDRQRLFVKYKDSIREEKNLEGSTMFPGMVDSHLHIIGHGEKLYHLDLSAMTSPAKVKDALKERSQHLKAGEWLVGEGWNENQWEDPRVLHKDELDHICPENPMILSRVCRHALLANTKAMELGGVDNQTKDPQGGVIMRDSTGEATGYFLDTAQELIKNATPEITKGFLTRLIQTAVDDLVSKGLVGGHSEDLHYYGGFQKTFDAFINAIDGVKRKFKAHLLVHHEVLNDMKQAGLDYGLGTDYVELGAVKIFTDGALGGRTAWLSDSYSDDADNYGISIHEEENLELLIKRARANGLPVAVHAIGDQAVWAIVKLIEKHPLTNGRRDRIIHAQILNPELYERLQKLDVVLDIQPVFVASDFPWVMERIGKTRTEHAYPWKTLLYKDIACAGGSDAPIEDVDPLLGIQAAVSRRSNIDNMVYNEDEELSVYEAITLYTKGSAYAIGQEEKRGVIAPGYTADFTVYDKDLFGLPKDRLTEAQVKMTIIEEQVVYKSE